VEVEIAAVRMVERLTDPPRQMNVGCLHHYRALPFLDVHDPVQRVLGLFLLFLVAREMYDLVLVAGQEFARDRQLAGRIAMIDPMTRLTELLVCLFGPRRLMPAPLMEDRAALRAHRGLRQLESGLVRIVDVLVDQPVTPRLPGNLALVLHLTLHAKAGP
jgi:hypothetical protein